MWTLSKTITRLRSKPTGRRQEWLLGAGTVVILITLIAGFIFAHTLDLPIGFVSILFSALIMLWASLITILSSEMKEVVTKGVQMPPGLARWIDLYASADPVPNGKTRVVDKPKLTSVPIWNLGSLLWISYWFGGMQYH